MLLTSTTTVSWSTDFIVFLFSRPVAVLILLSISVRDRCFELKFSPTGYTNLNTFMKMWWVSIKRFGGISMELLNNLILSCISISDTAIQLLSKELKQVHLESSFVWKFITQSSIGHRTLSPEFWRMNFTGQYHSIFIIFATKCDW